MTLNWRQNEYFESLLAQPEDTEAHTALELLVDDIHKDKTKTINAFLGHYGSEDFLWGLVRLLATENSRVAGNAAYIFGTLAEHDLGQVRVMSLINGPSPQAILPNLTKMLDYDDTECVMNAAGTMGTLAESKDGREWMLREQCMDTMLRKVTSLLSSSNMWTASNAALVLARLCISEDGCLRLLNHFSSLQILTKLIESLGMDEAGRGMNAAFAIGRLCDTDNGRQRLLHHRDSEKMLNSLCCMLASKDSGCGKNACYALSCLAASDEGHKRLLLHTSSELMLHLLGQQLGNSDGETGWFAAMTLRTLASKRQGVLRLRDHPDVVPLLKATSLKPGLHDDLREEVDLTLELLKHLSRPEAPRLEVKGPHEIEVTWPVVELKSGMPVTYRLFCDGKQIYEGKETRQLVSGLRPFTKFTFKLQLHTEGDDSPHSNESFAKTEDAAPDAPESLRILGVTTSQLRLGWAPPEYNNGGLKGYVVYNGKHQVETTSELNSIISGLSAATKYELHVCAYNHKGKGPKASLTATTGELGKHAPSKPTLTARGRSEIHVTWAPPEFPLGRLYRFELTTNGKVVYSGTDLSYTKRQLTPNTEYIFTVIAVTSEGKCESEPAKKRTLRDEYNVQSTAPVFFSHPTKASLEVKPSGKSKDRSNVRSPSRNSKRRDSSGQPKYTRSTSSPSSMDATASRPVSASSSSRGSKRPSRSARKHVGSSRSKPDVNRNRHIAALKEMELAQKSSTGEESSEWEEEERWPGHNNNSQVAGSRLQPDGQGAAQNGHRVGADIEFMSVSVTYKGSVDNSDQITGNIIEKSGSAESWDNKHRHKALKKDVSFDDKVYAKMKDKGNVPVATLREGTLEEFSAYMKNKKALLKHALSVKKQHSALEREVLKYSGDVLASGSRRAGKLPQSKHADASSKRHMGRHLDSLPYHDDRLGFNPVLAMHDLRLNDNSNVAKDLPLGAGDGHQFTLMANGFVLYQEKGDPISKAEKKRRKRSPGNGERENVLEVDKLAEKSSPFKEAGLVRPSWGDHYRYGASDSDDDALVGMATDSTDDISGGDKSLSSISKNLKKDIFARNPLMEHAMPSRSILADHASFYQRANTFISSHRPTLKKNLARLVAPGAHNTPQSATANNPSTTNASATYEPDFPTTRKASSSNRYQFIPTQFRTQPINLPGPLQPRANTLVSLQDKSAYLRKLEALSQTSNESKSVTFCNDCGREQDSKPVSLRYSHKHESPTFQMPSGRLKSGHGEMISYTTAR